MWDPPPAGIIKINWGAALNETKDSVGIRLVARDHEGSILATKKLFKTGFMDPFLAEAIRGFQAAVLANELGLNSAILEGDALQIVIGINHQLERWDSVGMILTDTRMLLSRLSHWQVVFVRRSGNDFAHCL